MFRFLLPLIFLLIAGWGKHAEAQITQSPTSVVMRNDRGSFTVTYRATGAPFEPGRGMLCTEVRDAYTGQILGPGQLLGRPVQCSGRILDRDPRPTVRGDSNADTGRGGVDGIYRYRDRVRLGSGTTSLALDALRSNGQGVVYWVREFQTTAYEREGRSVGLAVAVRPSGNALTGELAIQSVDIYVVTPSGERVVGSVRIDADTADWQLQARLRSSGSGQIDGYWIIRQPGQNSDRSTWLRAARVVFRTGASGWQLVGGPALKNLPLDRAGRYDVTLYFPPGARGVDAPTATMVTVWRPVQ